MMLVQGNSPILMTLRWCVCLVLIYISMEAWAQWRFSQNGIFLPANIRKNIAMNSLDAFRLKSSYRGVAKNGMAFVTDDVGFRIAPAPQTQPESAPLLLGGDSRVFGYALPWGETLAAILHEKKSPVRLQAFPGSSPAMFNRQIFQEGLIEKLGDVDTVIYGYDPFDVYNDQKFVEEIRQQEQYLSLRRLKVYLGGYAYTLIKQKIRTWQSRFKLVPQWWNSTSAETKKTTSLDTKTPTGVARKDRVNPISEDSLLEMKQHCDKLKLKLCLFYCPRMLELMQNNTKTKDRFVEFCEINGIAHIDFFNIFKAHQNQHGFDATHWFLDPHEGIHYAKSANELISNHIIEWIR